MGGRLIQTVSNHQKTITSLCFDSQRTRLFTGSLDQHVKVYDVHDYKVIYNFKHPAPVLTVACSVSIMYQLGESSKANRREEQVDLNNVPIYFCRYRAMILT